MRDVLVFQAGCVAGLAAAFVLSQGLNPLWRSAILTVGFGAGMAAVKFFQPDNAMTKGGGWIELAVSVLVVAAVGFLFEQPHLVGLSRTGVFLVAIAIGVGVLAVTFWRARARGRVEERDTHGQD